MGDERWQVLSDWLSDWLEADPRARVRLRDELAAKHPELVGEADRMSSSAESLTGFLDTPALVLAARELVVDVPALPAGATVGPYRVVELLARGGMGDVYRATDSRLARDVALKVLSVGRTSDPRRVDRFLMEARITASLDHPNIVRLYDVGRVNEQTYLVAELLDGETLRARIVRGAIGPDEVRRIGLEVARGLAAAHDAGLVHRDLKPENIFLTRNGQTKLLDFGIAKLTQDEAVPEGASTLTGVVLGTAGYLAPEQIRGDAVDGRADLFAFGAVLFEMITGERAFVRDQIVDTLHAILHDPPALVLDHRPGVPLSLATIVGRLLEKAPGARLQTAAELIGALERADVDQTRSWPVRQIARIRAGLRRRIWRAAAAAVIVAVVSAGVFLRNTSSLPAINSIAVLPFDNKLGDEFAYLSDGMTAGVIHRLLTVESLRVIGGDRAMRLDEPADVVKVAQALGVGAVVTGEVSRRGADILISARLFDGTDGIRLWAEELDGPKDDHMTAQVRIVLSTVKELRLRLSAAQMALLSEVGTSSDEAYVQYLKARFLLRRDMEEDDLDARKLFLSATAIDPKFLIAQMGVVATYLRSIGEGYAAPQEAVPHAKAELAKAAAIDPDHVAVRVSTAHLALTTGPHDWMATEHLYRALVNEPALLRTTAYHPVALFFAAIGDFDEAIGLVRRALKIDPGNIQSRVMLGNYLLQDGRLDDALEVFATIVDDAPEDSRPLSGIAAVYKALDNFPNAAKFRSKAHALAGEPDSEQAFKTATTEPSYSKAERVVAQAELAQLEFQKQAKIRHVPPYEIARRYLLIGNFEKAIASLEEAANEGGHVGLMLLKVDHVWDPIRADARFTRVLAQVGIR